MFPARGAEHEQCIALPAWSWGGEKQVQETKRVMAFLGAAGCSGNGKTWMLWRDKERTVCMCASGSMYVSIFTHVCLYVSCVCMYTSGPMHICLCVCMCKNMSVVYVHISMVLLSY